MKISVIICVYNEEAYLPGCLESLASQIWVEYEVIVVDDGSSPSRGGPLCPPGEMPSLPNFHYFKIKHGGTAVARNFGVTKATGEILVFVDGDMTFEPDFLKTLTEPIKKDQAKGTFSTEEFVANWDNVWARCWNYENGLYENRRIKIGRSDMQKDFRAILKTEFDRVKGFDDIGYTDTWSLSQKLGYGPVATKARYYHYNPRSQGEVLFQAMWIGARKRKGGKLGQGVAVIRATIPFSLLFGILKAWKTREWFFIRFKIIYDLGILGGSLKAITN